MTTPVPTAAQFGLAAIDQISFVVADADEAARRYEPIFGPFLVVDVPAMDVTYRGRPSTVTLKLGFGRSGPLEVELVQVVDGDSPGKDHLASHGEGFHHVRFPVSDLRATQVAMEDAGWVTTFAGESEAISFAYLEPPPTQASTVIELVQGIPAE